MQENQKIRKPKTKQKITVVTVKKMVIRFLSSQSDRTEFQKRV